MNNYKTNCNDKWNEKPALFMEKVCFGLIEEIYEKIFATGYCNIKNSGKQE